MFGTPRAQPAPPQPEPGNGVTPRVDVAKVAGHVKRLPHTLLGWCGADETPEVVPAGVSDNDETGLRLTTPPGAVPEGGRRAGLTSHEFWPRMIGQDQRVHTGWLTHGADGTVNYAPRTKAGYRLPRSKAVFVLGSASLATRMPAGRKAGIAPER